MLGSQLCRGGGVEHGFRGGGFGRDDLLHLRQSVGQRAGLVEHDGIHAAQDLQIKPAFDDGAEARRTTDGAEDRQGRSRRDAAGAGHDHHGNGRTHVAREQIRERGGAEHKIHEIARHAVGQALHRRARLLGTPHRLDDLPEAGVAAEPFGADLDRSGLVDRARIDRRARSFFHRHRFAGDARLIEERMAAEHGAVDGHARAGVHEHGVADPELGGIRIAQPARATDRNRARQEIQEITDCVPSTRDRHALQHFSNEHEQRNDERGEKLADGRRRHDRDGHRQFHRHAPGDQVLQRLLEDRPAADQQADDADQAHARDRLPDPEPHGRRGQSDEPDACCLEPREGMCMVMLVVGFLLPGRRSRAAQMRLARQAVGISMLVPDCHRYSPAGYFR